MSKVRAVLDACVLYSAPLRDFLMECAVADFYQPIWSEAIQEEWIRNLRLNRPDLPPARLLRTRDLMNQAIPQALTTDFEYRIETINLPDPGDRHVLAAALQSHSSVIVTFNFRHFPELNLAPYGVIARHPDHFLRDATEGKNEECLQMARRHRARLINPAKSAGDYIATLRENRLLQIAEILDKYKNEI